jgi:hypothetical protein
LIQASLQEKAAKQAFQCEDLGQIATNSHLRAASCRIATISFNFAKFKNTQTTRLQTMMDA